MNNIVETIKMMALLIFLQGYWGRCKRFAETCCHSVTSNMYDVYEFERYYEVVLEHKIR